MYTTNGMLKDSQWKFAIIAKDWEELKCPSPEDKLNE